jgi:rRNA maturation RNase YbeY
MAIFYYSEDISLPSSFKKRIISRWIKETALNYNKSVEIVTYLFCTDEKILEMNREYLQHDYYTDIITFDYSEHDKIAGDLVISLDTVKTNADKFGTNYMDELYRVIIHGILHLCGINDKTAEEQKLMSDAENNALSKLNNILFNK